MMSQFNSAVYNNYSFTVAVVRSKLRQFYVFIDLVVLPSLALLCISCLANIISSSDLNFNYQILFLIADKNY